GPVTISPTVGTPFSGAVATFTDPAGAEPNASDDPGGVISNHYTATISWGDNTTSAGTITLSSGTYTVSGSHTYATQGTFTVTVTIHHETAPATIVTSSAVVAPGVPPSVTPPANQTASEGVSQSFNLGSFTDP